MAITKQKRTKMETLIYSVFDALDPSKTNSTKYKTMFSKMSDAQFDAYFKKLFSNDNLYLLLDVVDFEHSTSFENIQKAADVLKVPLMEYVAMPFVNMNNDKPVITKHKVIVGYLHLKRMQQLLSKKNATSTDISSRSALTGQVVNNDKNGRISDAETSSLSVIGADYALRELLGPRADDKAMKMQMYADISNKGYVSIEDLPNRVENKVSLNTTDVYLLGMGIKSDLITDGLVLNKTLNE